MTVLTFELELRVPCVALGHKTVRYLRADVVAWLEQQRKGSK